MVERTSAHRAIVPSRYPHRLKPARMLLTDSQGRLRYAKPRHILDAALGVLRDEQRRGAYLGAPWLAGERLSIELGVRDRETFVALFLDSRNHLIESRELFCGTVNQCSVRPREVARVALQLNASAVIVGHNHPSGSAEPSEMDATLTGHLRDVLALVDVELLDHVVVAGGQYVSMAQRGLAGFKPHEVPPPKRRARRLARR